MTPNMLPQKSMLFVGEDIAFAYNGKPRRGIVEKVEPKYFTIKIGDKFKSFNWDKVNGLCDEHTGIAIL